MSLDLIQIERIVWGNISEFLFVWQLFPFMILECMATVYVFPEKKTHIINVNKPTIVKKKKNNFITLVT